MTQAIDATKSSSRAVIWNYRLDGSGGGEPQDCYPARVYVVSEVVVNDIDAYEFSRRPL